MEKMIADVVALGLPAAGIYFGMRIADSHGPAAFNHVMKVVGFGNMYRGMAMVAAGNFVTQHLVESSLDKFAIAIIRRRMSQGEAANDILDSIQNMPVSNDLKMRLKQEVQTMEHSCKLNTSTFNA